jgi:DNA repair exonuclease SbcCD ATPase subunit
MTRPLRLDIRGFRGWREGTVPLDRPVTLVVGENRSGKSSTLNAIEWCLFGRVVERKASGIDERADWEVERRFSPNDPKGDAGNGEDVEVALSVETDGGVARLVRRRKRGAGAREDDEFAVELPEGSGGRRLAEAEAHAWMDAHRFPDWETWRRACCQHQEILRSRLTVADDRSLVVSSLLGMEEHDRLARLLKDQQPGKLVHEIDGVLEDLDQVVLVRLKTPSEDLFESERKLGALGLERSRLSPALALEVGRRAIDRARGLAEKLGLQAPFPSAGTEADEPELRKWAEGWPSFVRKESKTGERLSSAQKKRAKLAAELEQLEPSE